jgi:hypothetical protein
MGRSADPNPFVGDNFDIFICAMNKAMLRIFAQVHLMVPTRNVECLGQFPRT